MIEKTAALTKVTSKSANRDAFRLDINALRALSVVAVVGFHFQIPGFVGGFVGVDVFLVITGYLMTTKVLNELKLGRFSLWAFGMMRMRRIYPALAVAVAASVVVGWFVTLPGEYLKHLLQALSALAFVSNFALSSDGGYFAIAAKPTAVAYLVAFAGVAVLHLDAACRFAGLARDFRRNVEDQRRDRCVAGFRSHVFGLVFVDEPARRNGIVFFLVARQGLGAVGGRINRCRRDPAPIRRNRGSFVAANADHRCRRLGGGRGLHRLSLARSAMAWRAHDPSDPGFGHDRSGSTGRPRRRPAGDVCDPAPGRLVLLDLSLALADLGVCPELVVRARVWRERYAEDFDGAGLAGARRGLVPLYRATRQNSARFLDAPKAIAGSGGSFAFLAGFVSLAFLNDGFPTRLPEYLLPAELARRNQHAT